MVLGRNVVPIATFAGSGAVANAISLRAKEAFHYLYQTNIWRQKVGGEQFEKANTVRARTKVVNACVFNSQLAFYEDGDFLIHLAGLKGVYKCLAASEVL